jgi:hypothetical protein
VGYLGVERALKQPLVSSPKRTYGGKNVEFSERFRAEVRGRRGELAGAEAAGCSRNLRRRGRAARLWG